MVYEAELLDLTHTHSSKLRTDLEKMGKVVIINAAVLELCEALIVDMENREGGEEVPALPDSFQGDLATLGEYYGQVFFDLIVYPGCSGSTVEEHLGSIVADFSVGNRTVEGLCQGDAMDLGDWILQTIIPEHPITQAEFSAVDPKEVFTS